VSESTPSSQAVPQRDTATAEMCLVQLMRGKKVQKHTFFKNGSNSSADQPLVFHESKSCLWPRVYTIQLIEDL
jgi:hypothetical protein